MTEKKSKYPQFIRDARQLGEVTNTEQINIVLCVLGLGRSPEEAKYLTDKRHPSFALAGGLRGLKDSKNFSSLNAILARALNVIATINEKELRAYAEIIRKINRHRTRNVIVSEDHEEIARRLSA